MARELRWFLLDKWVADMLISPRCSVDYETLGARISTNESTLKMMLDRVRNSSEVNATRHTRTGGGGGGEEQRESGPFISRRRNNNYVE